MAKPKIAIIISTTRAVRFGEKPAKWIYDIAAQRSDMSVELVDLRQVIDRDVGLVGVTDQVILVIGLGRIESVQRAHAGDDGFRKRVRPRQLRNLESFPTKTVRMDFFWAGAVCCAQAPG